MSRKGKVIILSGPSGSGKTTLYNQTLRESEFKGKIVRSISVTTRSKREGEVQGRDYIFVSRKMFLYKKRAGHFLESEKVFDNYYGTPNKNVQELLKTGKNVLLCIDVLGAKTVSRKIPGAITIFVKTPTIAILKKRLERRATETPETIKLRIDRAKSELAEAKDYQYVLTNDRLDVTQRRLMDILRESLSVE